MLTTFCTITSRFGKHNFITFHRLMRVTTFSNTNAGKNRSIISKVSINFRWLKFEFATSILSQNKFTSIIRISYFTIFRKETFARINMINWIIERYQEVSVLTKTVGWPNQQSFTSCFIIFWENTQTIRVLNWTTCCVAYKNIDVIYSISNGRFNKSLKFEISTIFNYLLKLNFLIWVG